MREINKLWFVFWAAMVAGPLIAAAVAAGCVPDVAEVPLHWGFGGEPNRWGTPGELVGIYWFLGGTMAAVNVLMAVSFFFNDKMYAAGLVHGVSKENAPKIYVGCAVLMVAITVAILIALTSMVAAAL